MGELNFVDYHGILMIIGWSLTAVAVSAAHYLPFVKPDKKVLGHHVWFHIHRTCNWIAVGFIVASTAFILWGKGAWTGPWFGHSYNENTSGAKWHSLIGAVAIVLAISQPIGALFRCAPNNPKYDIFVWIHRKVGKLADTAAAIALLIAILIFKRHFASVGVALFVYLFFFIFLLILAIGTNMAAWQRVQKAAVGHSVVNWAQRRGQSVNSHTSVADQTSEGSQIFLFFLKSGMALLTAIVLVLLIVLQ